MILLRHGCLNAEVGAVEAYYAQIVLLQELSHLIYKAFSGSSIEVPIVCVNAITLQVIDNIARIPPRATIYFAMYGTVASVLYGARKLRIASFHTHPSTCRTAIYV